jgi:Flp pilus assembly protein CpaB
LVLVQPAPTTQPRTEEPRAQQATPTLPPDQVATVLRVDTSAGAVSAAQVGDRVDVLAYFSREVTGGENVTRRLVSDVRILAVARDGGGAGLTLAVPQSTALLLHEAQALGARPYVVLRAPTGGPTYPPSLSDTDLAERLAAPRHGQVTSSGR